MLALQLEKLSALPPEIADSLTLIVVDDGSPEPARLPAQLPFEARLYRMLEDIPWNQDACRNLIAREAPDDWLLLTDMDHVAPFETLSRIIRGGLYAGHVYMFGRVTAPDMTPYKPHPNSWLMTRQLYEKAGGYDERFRGIYGTDGRFAKQLRAHADAILQMKEVLIRYPREVVPDASTRRYKRKSEANERRKAEMHESIRSSGELRPVQGLTRWERVR